MLTAWQETLEEGGRQSQTVLTNMTGGLQEPGPSYTWGAGSTNSSNMYPYTNMSFPGFNPNVSLEDMFSGGDMSLSEASPFDIYTRAVLIALYGAVFLCCAVGNVLVIVVVLRHRKMRTTTNFFLANLAVADLSVGFFCVLPNLGLYLSPFWLLGKVMCKLLYFVQMMSYAASITILTVISVERYFAILHPFRCKQLKTLCLLRTVLVIVWSAAAICGIPQLIFYSVVDLELPAATMGGNTVHLAFCIVVVRHNQQAYVTTNFVLWYLVPLCLMTIMYSRISVVLWRSSQTAGRMSDHTPTYESVNAVSPKGMCCGRYNKSTKEKSHHQSKKVQEYLDGPEEQPSLEAQGGSLYMEEDVSSTPGSYPQTSNNGTYSPVEGEIPRCCPPLTKSLQTPSSPASRAKANLGSTTDADQMELRSLVTKKTAASGSGNTGSGNSSSSCLKNGMAVRETLVQHVGGGQFGAATRTLLKNVRFRSEEPVEGALVARRRVIRLLIAVIVCFALCVLPYHVLMMWQTWRTTHQHPVPYGQLLAAPITFLIFYLNSALNPLLYAFLSDNFRRSLRELLQGRTSGTVANRNTRRRSTLSSKTNQTCV